MESPGVRDRATVSDRKPKKGERDGTSAGNPFVVPRDAKPCVREMARKPPGRQAPYARRREGLELYGRDDKVGAGRSPQSPAGDR